MADIPLIRNFDAGAVFAFRNRQPIRVEEFLGDVRRLWPTQFRIGATS